MPVIDIPEELRERLGEKGTKAFITILEKFEHEIKDDLTTRKDLKELELKLSEKIKDAEINLTEKINTSKVEILKWVGGMLFLFSTLIIGGIMGMIKL
jgi:hypothetical protein